VVAAGGKARICKSAADVKAFLGADAAANGASGTSPNGKPKGISPRMAALMRGESLPPRPVSPPLQAEPSAKAAEKAAPEPKKREPKTKAPAPPVVKAIAKPKPAPKPARAPAKAKKKK
jgi:hypothetical protein